jgi:hypothetical protein
MRNRVLTLAAAVLIPFAAASTQEVAAPTQAVAGPSNVISLQPLIAVFEVYAAEYERKVGSAATLGVGGTYWNLGDDTDDVTYKSGDLKLRYYPQGTALMGFSFGGSVGFTSVSATTGVDGTDESASGATVGVLLEYQWLMGAKRNVSLALGLGAKALMVDEDEITSGDFVARYPTGRVSIGFAF